MSDSRRRYDVSQWSTRQRLDCTSFTLRVLTGQDDANAYRLADAMGVGLTHARIMTSMVEVDDKRVLAETSPFVRWNVRTRMFALNAWGQLHGRPLIGDSGVKTDVVTAFAADAGIADWYDLSPYQDAVNATMHDLGIDHGLSIQGFAVRELTPADEMKIAVASTGNGATHAYARLTYAVQEWQDLDGARHRTDPDSPDKFLREPWRGWSWHTLEFVQAAYQAVHEPMEDIQDFLDSHAGQKSSAEASDKSPRLSLTG
jgi:hypothetical protein